MCADLSVAPQTAAHGSAERLRPAREAARGRHRASAMISQQRGAGSAVMDGRGHASVQHRPGHIGAEAGKQQILLLLLKG